MYGTCSAVRFTRKSTGNPGWFTNCCTSSFRAASALPVAAGKNQDIQNWQQTDNWKIHQKLSSTCMYGIWLSIKCFVFEAWKCWAYEKNTLTQLRVSSLTLLWLYMAHSSMGTEVNNKLQYYYHSTLNIQELNATHNSVIDQSNLDYWVQFSTLELCTIFPFSLFATKYYVGVGKIKLICM